jgi:hypothetical protein
MAIDTGKILKTSEEKYFELTGENTLNYGKSHIRVYVGIPSPIKETFAQCVNDNAEVVVGYKEKVESATCIYARGTALIPKKSK